MPTSSDLIQRLRLAVPVATRSECQEALAGADGDFDGALALLGPAQAEAEADRRDRLQMLARERQLSQLMTLAKEGGGGDDEWIMELAGEAYQGCLDDLLSGQFKTEPTTCYRLTQELASTAEQSGEPPLEPKSAERLSEIQRRAATQLLMATVVDYGATGESAGRVSFEENGELSQVRIFPRDEDDRADPLELVRAGADPNSIYGKNTGSYNEGKSVLMRVIENMGDEDLARELLKFGADPLFACGVKRDGGPAHNYTMLRSCYITVSEEVGAGTYATSTDEVRRRRAEVPMMGLDFVQLLLEQGVDPNLQNHRGGPLHYGASLDLPDHVLVLLKAGADPQQSFSTGGSGEMTPLHMARGYETTRLLLEWGANPRVKDDAGLTAEESALKHGGRDEKVRALEDWSRQFTPMFTIQVGDTYRRNRHLVRMETKALDGGPIRRSDLEAAIRKALDRHSFSEREPEPKTPTPPRAPEDETA